MNVYLAMGSAMFDEFRIWWAAQLVEKTLRQEECSIWLQARDIDGYGVAHLPRRFRGLKGTSNTGKNPAHRLSCIAANGEPASLELMALHSCDNPSCVSSSHLRWGTALDDTSDMLSRFRHRSPIGEAHGGSRLNERDIKEIRKMCADHTQKSIAEHFGVAQSTISRIVSASGKRKTWNHV